ncbi:MAG TPA: hypothetical protein VME43_26855 [Bryobacteraceae bacterium]|nr:hypothetical protein [Bryobacteraceae bacterium]
MKTIVKSTAVMVAVALAAGLACPVWARVEAYGPQRYTRVGGHEAYHGGHAVVIDRRRGPGWAGVIAGGILGAAAGLALGSQLAPAPVVVAPPVMGTVVPVLPGACATVPAYNGGVLYDCGNIYYQPFYEGTSLMFEVVPAP